MNKSFLIINPFGIGDVLFSTPLIRNIKETFPESRIYYLCNRRTYPVLANHPFIQECFIYERDEFQAVKRKSKIAWIKKVMNLISEIRKKQIQTSLDLSLNSQFGFFSWAAGIKQRIGYDYHKRGRFLTKKIKFSGYKDKHVVEYYLDLLKFIGVQPKYKKMELFLKGSPEKSSEPFVVIAPGAGASWGKEAFRKHWPKEKFAQLAGRLIDELGLKVVIAGSTEEAPLINSLTALMHNQPVKVVGLGLDDFSKLLRQTKLLITNDGGPLHMAVALGIKTVSIFGPVSDLVYGPYPRNSNNIVVKTDFSCQPCYENFRLSECSSARKCLESIQVSHVFDAAKSLL